MGGGQRAKEELSEEGMEQGGRGGWGAREGRKLQGRYPEEVTGQQSQTIPQRGTWP